MSSKQTSVVRRFGDYDMDKAGFKVTDWISFPYPVEDCVFWNGTLAQKLDGVEVRTEWFYKEGYLK